MSIARIFLILVIVLGVGYVNAISLLDAYGSGAPYYGRTTNMDKWENPLPWLAVIDRGFAGRYGNWGDADRLA